MRLRNRMASGPILCWRFTTQKQVAAERGSQGVKEPSTRLSDNQTEADQIANMSVYDK